MTIIELLERMATVDNNSSNKSTKSTSSSSQEINIVHVPHSTGGVVNHKPRIGNQRHLSDPVPSSNSGGIQDYLHLPQDQQQQRHLSGDSNNVHQHGQHDPDLFSILNTMHLSSHIIDHQQQQQQHQQNIIQHHQQTQLNMASNNSTMPHPGLVASRKRKILDGGGHGGFSGNGSGKMNGTRNPAHRRASEDEDEAPLQTPQCSQSGYADEEDRHATEAESHQAPHKPKRSGGFISPEMHDIVDENLAADFGGSLSGLGVDIHTASFSMSEALNALPNLSISSSQIFKQEIPSPAATGTPGQSGHSTQGRYSEMKHEGCGSSGENSRKNYGALDLSNDEAYLPESTENPSEEDSGPMTFTGTVSRESTPSTQQLTFSQQLGRFKQDKTHIVNLSASNPNLSSNSPDVNCAQSKPQKIIIPLHTQTLTKSSQSHQLQQDSSHMANLDNMKLEKRSYETIAISEIDSNVLSNNSGNGPSTTNSNGNKSVLANNSENFQYILAASTSIATKISEPSITYLNQGQAYELRMKKSGDLSPYRKRLLKSVLRICFHERRLQYMEAEQIAEWSSKHPGERIIDVDLPLSYGVLEPYRDNKNINVMSFKWDPTRDTGIFIKVNCISTEFTPKKHGGEKGVPFRLQVETYDCDSRIHAAGCILQVFKLKGADRKHKQDRDKISKRPVAEQEKYAPSFDSTVLTDLPLEHIFVPSSLSRPESPVMINPNNGGNASVNNSMIAPTTPLSMSMIKQVETPQDNEAYRHMEGVGLEHSATPNEVTAWLIANRFSSYSSSFRNYDGRDMLRLTREEIVTLCGPGDGIRLWNNLNMVPVPPKTVIYVGGKDGDNEYSALYLDELTVAELLKKLTEAFAIDLGLFARVFLTGPKGIYVHVSDSVVRHMKAESVYQFSLKACSQNDNRGAGFDVVFEEVTIVSETRMSNSSPATSNSNG